MADRDKKKSRLGKTLLSLLLLIPQVIGVTRDITSLISWEAKIAGQSLIKIIVLIILFAGLLTSTWLCLLAMLIVYLISLHWSLILTLLLVFLINLLLLLIVGLIISKLKKNLLFPVTSRRCRSLCRTRE